MSTTKVVALLILVCLLIVFLFTVPDYSSWKYEGRTYEIFQGECGRIMRSSSQRQVTTTHIKNFQEMSRIDKLSEILLVTKFGEDTVDVKDKTQTEKCHLVT